MEIVILEYSDGKVIRVSLNAVQEKDFNKDSDTFIEMLSEIYSFRVKDINWMVTHDLDENHNLSDDIGENCEELRYCDNCGKLMKKGYYLDGYYACSDECCLALYDGDKQLMQEDLSYAGESNSEYYYTEWEAFSYEPK